ncbi:MAG: hypothetical protein JO039_23625 [Solirubrobacterales bacterium]|nr:hypothetical protein [Solirubrobacterales bacterium]
MPLQVFRVERVSAGNLLVAIIYSAFFPMFFFLTLYLQRVLHYTPIETGLLSVPLGLAVFVMSVLAPRLVARFRARAVITAGMLLAAGRTGADDRHRARTKPRRVRTRRRPSHDGRTGPLARPLNHCRDPGAAA